MLHALCFSGRDWLLGCCLFVVGLLLTTSAGWAEPGGSTRRAAEKPLRLHAGLQELFVEPGNYSVLEDPTGQLTLREVQSAAWAGRFVTGSRTAPNMERPGAAYWLRLTVQAEGPQPQHWYLELFDSHLNDVRFYPDARTGRGLVHTGADQPFASRPFGYKNFLLRLPLRPDQAQTYYLRLQSDSKTSFLSRLRTEQTLSAHFQHEYGLLGGFYGILLIMVVYNLCLYFFTGEQTYLRYVLYVVSSSLVFLSEDGLGFQFLWPNAPGFNRLIITGAPILLLLTFGYYARQFLDAPQRLPGFDPLVRNVVLLSVGALLVDAVWWQTGWSFWLYLLPYGLLFYAAVRIWRAGFRPARFFVLCHTLLAVSVMFLILRKLGIHAFTNTVTVYSMNAAFVLEVVVLSYALGEKIKGIQDATLRAQGRLVKQLRKKHEVQQQLVEQLHQNQELKDQLNTELENLVARRTEELRQQGETIAAQNRELLQANGLLALQSAAIEKLNGELQHDLQRAQTARVLAREVDFGEFSQIYPDKEACLAYLADLKWTGGYHCRKCGHDNYCEGREPHSRRCTRCRYVESATAYTLLQKCKFSIVKAFYAVFLLHTHKGSFSAQELSRVLELRRATCWSFSQKVLEAMRRQAGDDTDATRWTRLLLDDAGSEMEETVEAAADQVAELSAAAASWTGRAKNVEKK
ncbi:7TM diverse intracellular signaling domain-containing protein [Hymenobacter sp. B81]|uniref:7TM diverse intracellular signaling domain-containing protein n=1 Tax=Hymenobacter sp. B81 TaxID=3344878 RepID=UPI0037DD9F85